MINNGTPYYGKHSNILSFAALSAAVIFWGVSFVGMRIVLGSLSPMSAMWCRLAAAFIVLLPFARRLIPRNYLKGDWKLLLPMVLFQPCLYFLLETNALTLTTSTQAGVISAAVPVLTAIGAWIFMREQISKTTVAGLVLSIAGVAVLTLSQGTGGDAVNPVLGNMMEVGAMVCAAANFLLVKKLCGRYNPWTLTAMQVTAGIIFFIPGGIRLFGVDSSVWTAQLIMTLVFLGVFVSLGAFGLYNWGISRLDTSKASVFINLVPVVAIITGWIILGESLTIIQLGASAGIIAGVMLGQKAGSGPAREHESQPKPKSDKKAEQEPERAMKVPPRL